MDNEFNGSNLQTIEISLPGNAAYVSSARLAASSIAGRLNFDVDEIEDIKAAVSEACSLFIENAGGGTFTITFAPSPGKLSMKFRLNQETSASFDDAAIGILMIKALMDKFETDYKDKRPVISMQKIHHEFSL
ncbi:MAG: hypothetical protein LBU36_00165 [Clostridiales bacterium]|jgi:serine/threonine-protein kinase RsbW|nr:hypothetical protein [Clostridiales bacterium]